MQRSNLLLFNLIEIVSILKVRGFRNDAKALGIITDNHLTLYNTLSSISKYYLLLPSYLKFEKVTSIA